MNIIKNISIISPIIARHGLLMTLPAMVFVSAGVAISPRAYADYGDSINVHPATCFTPYLEQATSMRWHEFFLVNPLTSQPTWVICPLPFIPESVRANYDQQSVIRVLIKGARFPEANKNELPDCNLSVVSSENERMEYENFKYPRDTDTINLTSLVDINTNSIGPYKWRGEKVISIDDIGIKSNIQDATDPQFWSMSVVCKLPSGYGISHIKIWFR